MSKYNELVKKLKEIFQIDRPELDFGIYRILNARADEINDYLDNKLKAKIQSALADAGNANKSELEHQLQLTIKAATDAGVDPADSPKVQELKKQLAAMASGANEHENAVFSHLLTFFSRYYDNGDFISKRRYKGNTYAIPYSGEEVMLHWANKDQYYIKSGENFANYSFKLEDGRKVSFKLLAADTAKDNRKDNELDRCFVLIEPHVRTKIDEEGDEYEQEYKPVEVVKSSSVIDGKLVATEELVIHFEYKAMKKGTKQDALVQSAISTILADKTVQQHWVDLAKRAPTEKNPSRTELERHLTTYTQRNTADYFIHKDLGGFLTNELDFYIKNEVMNLDNVQNAEVFANIEKQLRMIQCLRAVALELITFLAQIENFQKKLWTKKKFVSSTDYLITVNNLSKELQQDVLKNTKQWEQWYKLGLWPKLQPGTELDLQSQQYLVIDTRLFDPAWKNLAISEINELDDTIDAIIINSDNYHALNLIQAKYNSTLDCIHIDPPYNTETSGFLYKNNFKHSSWLSMMENRLSLSKKLLREGGDFICHIDENEYESLDILFSDCGYLDHGTLVWDKKNPMLGRKGIATQHEYICFKGNEERIVNGRSSAIIQMQEYVKELLIENNGVVTDSIRGKYKKWLMKQDLFTGGDKAYKYIDDNGNIYRLVAMGAPEKRTDPKFYIPLIHPITGKACPVPPNGWSRSPETMQQLINDGLIVFGINEETQPQKIVYLRSDAQKQLTSILSDGKSGKAYLDDLGLSFPYCHPVSMYESLLATRNTSSYFMDFFAGSGTNGHAVINLMRNNKIRHKQILVEMGGHFDDILIPRITKVIFSDQWRNGVPKVQNGISYIAKILKIETYEDTLNNISLLKKDVGLFDFISTDVENDYLLKYMFDEDSKGSILNTDNFKKPFNYEMDIATDSAGATERKNIDLVETFNYLIGLHVKSIESNIERGYVRVEGTLPTGERTLILWRDCDKIGYEGLNKYANRFDLYAKENTFDVIYINGDHNLPTAFTVDEEDGEIVRSLKIRQIEPEFLNLMFTEEV
ncbi:DNA methyltransferase [Escherichia albertii]|uniref:DNA methyltransferase n=1 Tax=Escherichia albertii TaxID=208962 RepID=UPI000DE38884|nr:DNA methyltransferase [Escherichia albertii]EFB7456410.1 site-specific DNA-methyltransferase [Escherichia albertii]EFO4717351.1 site-specific DNA-methyltransferase [Escherichia albertii]MCZ8599370.1 DNA methyltransferase [Escherichia albertii]